MEEWVEENEDIGGPQGTLETFNFLISEIRRANQQAQTSEQRFNQIRQMAFGFIKENEMTEKWDKYVEEQENAVQKQQTEEVSVQEEAQSSEEVSETSSEEK